MRERDGREERESYFCCNICGRKEAIERGYFCSRSNSKYKLPGKNPEVQNDRSR
jgi:hypothetical protein